MARPPENSDATPVTLDVSRGRAAGFYELIRADVIAGNLVAGERLSEAALSRKYGVSRSPVREALASLERAGLVERVGLVARVRERTESEVLDIYQVRVYLEGAIASDAAQRRHPMDVHRLDAAIQAADGVDTDDLKALVAVNRLFHDALAVASHNETLRDLQNRLTAQVATIRTTPSTTLGFPGRWQEAHEEHVLIARAVAANDADTARAVAERHMARSRDIRIQLFAKKDSDNNTSA